MTLTLTKKELEVIKHIRNYLSHEGRMPSVRELMHALQYKSPHSISLITESLLKNKVLQRKSDGKLQLLKSMSGDNERAQTIEIPLVGSVACGTPVLAEENIEAFIPVSDTLARMPHKYFMLRAKGDSMNMKGIHDGDIVLVKQKQHAESGEIVVALIDDEATIKEIKTTPVAIILKPRSTNKAHKPIILNSDFKIQGVVVTTIPDL
jgi:repressor LexA